MTIRKHIELVSETSASSATTNRDSLLLELRRNPEINRKVPAVDALQRYAGRRDVFVSFTHDVGSMTHKVNPGDLAVNSLRGGGSQNVHGAKLGINPQSEHNTPTGIYGYPIDYVLQKNMDVPFAHARPFIWVFQIAPGTKVLDLNDYTDADLKKDLAKLESHRYARAINAARINAKPDTAAGQIWNVTRTLASHDTRARLVKTLSSAEHDRWAAAFQEYIEDNNLEDDLASEREFAEQYVDHDDEPDEQEVEASTPPRWSKLLRSLGYGCAVDLQGSGLIHNNEPTQGVFFSKAAIKTLELVRNIDPQEPRSRVSIWMGSPKTAIAAIRNGTVSADDLYAALEEAPGLLREIGADNIPDEVMRRVGDNAFLFLRGGFGSSLPDLKLNDRQMIDVLRKVPRWAGTLDHVSTGVAHYIETNIDSFLVSFLELPLPASFLTKYLYDHPEISTKFGPISGPIPAWYQHFVADHQSTVLDHKLWDEGIEPRLFVSSISRQLSCNNWTGMETRYVLRRCIGYSDFDRFLAICEAIPASKLPPALEALGPVVLGALSAATRTGLLALCPQFKSILKGFYLPTA